MQFTITLLPCVVHAVNIPRRCLKRCTAPLLRQLFLEHTFFHLTGNNIELSLFTQHHHDFLKPLSSRYQTSIEISEKWCVLQVDSHTPTASQLDDSGARVYDLSLPLASAGISILYQATYSSDFIFVQERDAGFDLYSDNPNRSPSPISSPALSPISESDDRHTSTNTSLGSVMSELNDNLGQSLTTRTRSPAGKVELLPSSLACVGLADTEKDSWILKIMKLVAFPDLIPSSESSSLSLPAAERALPTEAPQTSGSDGRNDIDSDHPKFPPRPFFSFTVSSDGSSLTTDVVELATLFPPSERYMVKNGGELEAEDLKRTCSFHVNQLEDDTTLKCLQIDLQKFGLDKHGLVNRFSKILREHQINHLYSSTYRTANILVDQKHAAHAQTLLQDN
ncbi:hypothetical protein DL96DRAFT_1592451 [Flagelloscypha sp. PMI_526]|nr:hypothetical protein DL96DRAFT_1592451 [Flagelloscypha sp. PMI_526]